METLQEALEKSKVISEEIDNVLNAMTAYQLGRADKPLTRKELGEFQKRLGELRKEQLAIYQEINRLSNGSIHISKDGLKLSIRNKKH